MHAISSYHGNRPTNTQTNKQTNKQTHRQDWLQYNAPLSLARSVTTTTSIWIVLLWHFVQRSSSQCAYPVYKFIAPNRSGTRHQQIARPTNDSVRVPSSPVSLQKSDPLRARYLSLSRSAEDKSSQMRWYNDKKKRDGEDYETTGMYRPPPVDLYIPSAYTRPPIDQIQYIPQHIMKYHADN